MNLRIGYAEDAHRLAAGRSLVIGNVRIGDERGAVAHSDGDVLLHALADALLSAFALGDIGHYYPPSDEAFKDMDSADILRGILDTVHREVGEVKVHNLAAVVTLDRPKLGSHREDIQTRVAALLELNTKCVGITFKTSEGLAPEHIQSAVTVLLEVL